MLGDVDLTDLPMKFADHYARSTSVVLTGHFYSVAVTPSSVPAWDTIEYDVTVRGLRTTDIVVVNRPAYQDELPITGARVSANNTLSITYLNMTGAPVTPTSETLSVLAIRKEKE